MTPDELEHLHKAVIGAKNQDYYLSQFSRLHENGNAAYSWHWPAFFLSFPWFLYRKMWLHAVIYLLLPFLLLSLTSVAAAMIGKFIGAVLIIATLLYLAIIFIWVPGHANILYYRHSQRKIARAERASPQWEDRIAKLCKRGGTSMPGSILASLLTIAMLAFMLSSAYQFLMVREQVNRAYFTGINASEWVSGFYEEHQILPNSLKQAGFIIPLPQSVKEINMEQPGGVITMTLAIPSLAGKTLQWKPSSTDTLAITWTCSSPDIPNRYLPNGCKLPAKAVHP